MSHVGDSGTMAHTARSMRAAGKAASATGAVQGPEENARLQSWVYTIPTVTASWYRLTRVPRR